MRQDADVQKQCHVNNTHKPSIIPNPTVTGKIKENSFLLEPINNNKIFFSQFIIKDIQSFLSEVLREDDKEVNAEQTNQKNNSYSESFISDKSEDLEVGWYSLEQNIWLKF